MTESHPFESEERKQDAQAQNFAMLLGTFFNSNQWRSLVALVEKLHIAQGGGPLEGDLWPSTRTTLEATAVELQLPKPITSSTPNIVQFALDTQSHCVLINGEHIPLTETQFELVAVLYRHAPGWVGRKDFKAAGLPTDRPDRLILRLPTKVLELIASKPGKGSRLKIAQRFECQVPVAGFAPE